MIQRFIELGEGYSDLYELIETAKANKNRADRLLLLKTEKNGSAFLSAAVVMKPTDPGGFQAIYLCREGIPDPAVRENKRYTLIQDLAEELGLTPAVLTVKPSSAFHEAELYYQYLIGILRLNHLIPPMK